MQEIGLVSTTKVCIAPSPSEHSQHSQNTESDLTSGRLWKDTCVARIQKMQNATAKRSRGSSSIGTPELLGAELESYRHTGLGLSGI